MSPQRKRLLIAGAIVLLIALVALLLNGYVRETIAPAILAWLWRVSIMSSGFPQVIVWAFFIATIPIFAIFSLIQGGDSDPEEEVIAAQRYEGQVSQLSHWLNKMPEGDYFRLRMLRYLAQLVISSLAHRERIPVKEARAAVREGTLGIPEDVRQALLQGMRKQSATAQMTTYSSRLARNVQANRMRHLGWEDPTLKQLLHFLEQEHEMEVERDS